MQRIEFNNLTNMLKVVYNGVCFENLITPEEFESNLITLDVLDKLILKDSTIIKNCPGLNYSIGFKHDESKQTLTITIYIWFDCPPLKKIEEVHNIMLYETECYENSTDENDEPIEQYEQSNMRVGNIFVYINENCISYVNIDKKKITLFEKNPFYIDNEFKKFYLEKNWYTLTNSSSTTIDNYIMDDIDGQFIEMEYIYQDIVNFFNKKYHLNSVILLKGGTVMMLEINQQLPPNQHTFSFIVDIENYQRDNYDYNLLNEYKIQDKYIYLIEEYKIE